MKKFLTLSLMVFALLAQAKTYTLADLAELVPLMEDGTGVAVVDGAYVINLPTTLPDGVNGIAYDDNNIVLSKKYFTINGDLTISEGEVLMLGGATEIEVNGNLTIDGATIKPAQGAEGTAKGFRMYTEGVSATLTNCSFINLGINYGNGSENGCLTATGCTFTDHNGKSGNAVINFTSLSKGNTVQDCLFDNPTLSAVGSGANVPCGILFKDNIIKKPAASNRLYPGINMSATGPYDIVIEGNEVHGAAQTTRSGGIALACLLGNPPTGTLYVRDNFVENCSYGITLTGPGNVHIENNTVLNNRYIADPNLGGSGINITCNATGDGILAKAYLRGNHIEGNIWGVTIIGTNVDINAGKIVDGVTGEAIDPSADDFNPGENVFVNNSGTSDYPHCDWFNNTITPSYAQGNTWDVEVQDEEHIAQNVYTISDMGVVYTIPAAESVAITDVKSDEAVKRTGRYNILGQPVGDNYHGIVIENGKKVVK